MTKIVRLIKKQKKGPNNFARLAVNQNKNTVYSHVSLQYLNITTPSKVQMTWISKSMKKNLGNKSTHKGKKIVINAS